MSSFKRVWGGGRTPHIMKERYSMKPGIESAFYGEFILLKSVTKRQTSNFLAVKCNGAKDGERLELYINGNISGVYVVSNGVITIPILPNTKYRLASPKYPYGMKFNTVAANDGTGDILVFHSVQENAAEIKNLYRIIEYLCENVEEQKKQIEALSGYRTE